MSNFVKVGDTIINIDQISDMSLTGDTLTVYHQHRTEDGQNISWYYNEQAHALWQFMLERTQPPDAMALYALHQAQQAKPGIVASAKSQQPALGLEVIVEYREDAYNSDYKSSLKGDSKSLTVGNTYYDAIGKLVASLGIVKIFDKDADEGQGE